jgi:D-apionate oxidoisomerase
MESVALFGAGGKIGQRIAAKLQALPVVTRYVETDPGRRAASEAQGRRCVDPTTAVAGARVVILAVPDVAIGGLARQLSPELEPGCLVVILDAAAPHSQRIVPRADCAYLVTHPCHPPLFPDGLAPDRASDHFGMVAPQDAVAALLHGTAGDWDRAEAIVRQIWAPVSTVHRLTVEQIAILEPGLVEVTSLTLLSAVRDALDRVVAGGVPEAAARSFLMGHLHVELAMLFGYTDAVLSDGAKAAVARSRSRLLQPDWITAVDPASVRRATDEIVGILPGDPADR